MGFSAGGHLCLMAATSSMTKTYEPVDEIDKLPCNINFAIPVYPAYALDDGVDNENTGGGNDAQLVKDFAFDEKTPPMCFIHGDGDGYSSMASVMCYRQLRKMGIRVKFISTLTRTTRSSTAGRTRRFANIPSAFTNGFRPSA